MSGLCSSRSSPRRARRDVRCRESRRAIARRSCIRCPTCRLGAPRYGIIGSVLLEMALNDKISIVNDRLVLKNDVKFDNPIFSEVSMKIKHSKKPRKIKHWITKLAGKSRKYKWIILSKLENINLIRVENKKFLGFIPYRKSYLTDLNARTNLIQQLKEDINLSN